MKQQTAMQRLREQTVDALKRHEKGLHDHEKGYKQCLNNLLNNIDLHLLEKEKEQIEDAFYQGENNSVDYFNPENRIKESEQYYNETYGGNK
jgi:uncharacterized protein YpuA (DUF1002 family)